VDVEGEGECSEVAVAEYGAVQLIEGLVIETFCDIPSRVPQRTVDAQDCAGNGIPVNPVREGITGGSAVGQRPLTTVKVRPQNVNCVQTDGAIAQINVVEVRA